VTSEHGKTPPKVPSASRLTVFRSGDRGLRSHCLSVVTTSVH
jgi:hypothetical protein